jgi:hypothetical protein
MITEFLPEALPVSMYFIFMPEANGNNFSINFSSIILPIPIIENMVQVSMEWEDL